MYKPIIHNNLWINRWYVFSKKLNREVILYGPLEYDHWVLIEMDPLVTNYCEKPLEISHSYFGKPDKALIDMWVEKNKKEEFISITYAQSIERDNKQFSSDTFEKINSIKLWTQANNKNHKVITDHNVYSNSILLDNLKLLLPYNYPISTINPGLKKKIVDCISGGVQNILDLEARIAIDADLFEIQKTIYMLITNKFVLSNIDKKPIGPETEVYLV